MSGIFGVVSKKDCLDDLFYGVDYHSHMGTERAGLAVVRKNEYRRVIHDISRRQFKSRFFDELSGLHGHLGIGVISDRDPQPLVVGSRHGQFAIAVAGFIGNLKSLRSELYQHGQSLIEINNNRCNSVEVVSRFICQANTIIEGIKTVWSKIKGSSTIVILKKDEILAARDRFGYLPLVIGQKENSLAVASESCSLKNLGYKIVYYLAPGEIVLLRPNRFYIVQKGNSIMQICAFLWIYTGNPASTYEEINVENVRGQCGKYLALRDDIEADMVAGVPDSGTGHAVGYAIESGLP
jgi:amidophosphoribosyltransferase